MLVDIKWTPIETGLPQANRACLVTLAGGSGSRSGDFSAVWYHTGTSWKNRSMSEGESAEHLAYFPIIAWMYADVIPPYEPGKMKDQLRTRARRGSIGG